MKENEKRVSVLVEEEGQNRASNLPDDKKSAMERIKKPLLFLLMGIVFLGCMYLIFKPSPDKKEIENIGLNDAVPQATGAGMQPDKQKAYELEMLEKKNQEKRGALTTLSDYWNNGSVRDNEKGLPDEEEGIEKSGSPALNSYRNTQSALGTFYQHDNTETAELRKQLDVLKEELADKDIPKAVTVDDANNYLAEQFQKGF